MTLTELNVYFLKTDLFVHRFGEKSGFFGIGRRALSGSPVMYDQMTEDGWHIFHVMDTTQLGLYVKVPDDYLADQISDVEPVQV